MHRTIILAFLPLLVGCNFFPEIEQFLLDSGARTAASPADRNLGYEEVAIPTVNGLQLSGFWTPARSGKPRGTVLIHTGMQGNIEYYIPVIPWFAEQDLNVLVYDWQGFGASDGDRLFVNFEADTHAAVDYLLKRPEPSAQVIVHFGVSLGAAPALAAAARYPDQTAGVIYFGGFVPNVIAGAWLEQQLGGITALLGSVSDVVFGVMTTGFLDPRTHMADVQVPILTLISRDDQIVPFGIQLDLYKMLPEPKDVYFTFGGHIEAHLTDPDLGKNVAAWTRRLDGLLQPNLAE